MVLSNLLGGAAGGASVFVTIQGVDKFSKTFAAASLGIKGIETAMKIAAVAIVGTAAALTAIGITAAKTAAEFETAFTGVRKTVELTEKEFGKLEQRFKDMSRETPITFVELSKIGELAGQLGVEGVDNLAKFTKTIADISVTTNMTSEIAATEFARIANVMQLPLDQVDRMGATIVDLGNNFATTEAEISTFAQRIAGAGKIAGLTTDEVMAIGAALSSVGVQAEAGGTAVQKMLIEMNTSVQIGGESLEIFAKTTGQTAEEFAASWEKEAGPTFARFIEGLGKQGDAAVTTLDDLGMADVRLVRSFLSLANAGDLITRTLDVANEAWDENTALVEEAQKRYETFDSELQTLKNSWTVMKAEMGEEFLPVLKELVIILRDDVLPALEPLISLFGEFFKKAIQTVMPHLEGMATKFTDLATIFLEDILPTALELGKMIGGFLVDRLKMFFEIIKPIIPVVINLAKTIFDAAKTTMQNLLPALKSLVPTIINFLHSLQPLIPKILELIEVIVKAAIELINNLLPAIQELIPYIIDLFESIKPLIPKIFELIAVVTKAAIEIIKELVPVVKIIIDQLGFWIDILIDIIPPVAEFIGKILALAVGIQTKAAPAINFIKDIFLKLAEVIKIALGWFGKVLDGVGEFLDIDMSSKDLMFDGVAESATFATSEVIKLNEEAGKPITKTITIVSETKDAATVSAEKSIARSTSAVSATESHNIQTDLKKVLGKDVSTFQAGGKTAFVVGNASYSAEEARELIGALSPKEKVYNWGSSEDPDQALDIPTQQAASRARQVAYEAQQIASGAKSYWEQFTLSVPVGGFSSITDYQDWLALQNLTMADIKPSSHFTQVNDFILSKGKLIKTHKDDVITGTKNGAGMGTTYVFNIDRVQGMDPREMAEAFQRELNKKISLI